MSVPLVGWIGAAVLAGAAVAANRPAPAPPRPAPPPIAAVAPLTDPRAGVRADAGVLRDRNPFRLERAPTLLRLGAPPQLQLPPQPPVGAAPAQPPPPPPSAALAVSGIVGGPPWLAVVEHVPGAARGVALGVGESAAGVRVLWIRGDSVAVAYNQRTSVLLLKRP